MKIFKYLSVFSFLAFMIVACEKGIDPISAVDPGPDVSAPELEIGYPLEGTLVRVPDVVATITIKLVATDDIEISKVRLLMDGAEITSFTSFKDYRRAVIEYNYNNVVDGDHTLSVEVTDLAGKATTKSVNFKKVAPYAPLDGEVFYMPFDGDYSELVTFNAATAVGSPTFVDGKFGQAYAGAADSYIKFPAAGLLGSEFSSAFWYKLNATPKRGGMLAISPPGDSRNSGFRMAREDSGPNQNLFVNFGIGESEVWMNPFYQTASDSWMHIAVSISSTKAIIYVNGEVVKETDITAGIDWAQCTSISMGSGAPNFTYWEHFSDLSQYDDLRIFNKALSAEEVSTIFNMK